MKRLYLLLAVVAMVGLLGARAEAGQFGPIRDAGLMVTSQGSATELVRHRCFPSRCWCNSRGQKMCTRDCRRDRHCRWVWDPKSPCCERWVCKKV